MPLHDLTEVGPRERGRIAALEALTLYERGTLTRLDLRAILSLHVTWMEKRERLLFRDGWVREMIDLERHRNILEIASQRH